MLISGSGRIEDGVEGVLRPGGVVSVGLRQVAEAILAADDGDGGVGLAGEVAWHVARMGAAAVFVVGENANIVQTIFHVPVVPDQLQKFLWPGATRVERGQTRGHLGAVLDVLEAFALALDRTA